VFIKVNNETISIGNCDGNPSNDIAVYPLPTIKQSTPQTKTYTQFIRFVSLQLPAKQAIPSDYFMYFDSELGGCGWAARTDGGPSAAGIAGANIGFR
jgi:hypothetical protein